jgi:hypothetical protein
VGYGLQHRAHAGELVAALVFHDQKEEKIAISI